MCTRKINGHLEAILFLLLNEEVELIYHRLFLQYMESEDHAFVSIIGVVHIVMTQLG